MSTIDSLNALLVEELRDLYDAEKRLARALPGLITVSESRSLSDALRNQIDETNEHVKRLEDAFALLDRPANAKMCRGMRSLIEEGGEQVAADYDNPSLRDAAIIGAVQRVEHYEIAAYGTAIAHARLLDLAEVAELLEETLNEEKAADMILTAIAQSTVNPMAAEPASPTRALTGD